jgi:hypothetical protein
LIKEETPLHIVCKLLDVFSCLWKFERSLQSSLLSSTCNKMYMYNFIEKNGGTSSLREMTVLIFKFIGDWNDVAGLFANYIIHVVDYIMFENWKHRSYFRYTWKIKQSFPIIKFLWQFESVYSTLYRYEL